MYRRICSFANYSSHPVRNIFWKPWTVEWLGIFGRRYPAYHSDLRTPPHSLSVAPPPPKGWYENGGQKIWPSRLPTWLCRRRTVKRYQRAFIRDLWFFSDYSAKQLCFSFVILIGNPLVVGILYSLTRYGSPSWINTIFIQDTYSFILNLRNWRYIVRACIARRLGYPKPNRLVIVGPGAKTGLRSRFELNQDCFLDMQSSRQLHSRAILEQPHHTHQVYKDEPTIIDIFLCKLMLFSHKSKYRILTYSYKSSLGNIWN